MKIVEILCVGTSGNYGAVDSRQDIPDLLDALEEAIELVQRLQSEPPNPNLDIQTYRFLKEHGRIDGEGA